MGPRVGGLTMAACLPTLAAHCNSKDVPHALFRFDRCSHPSPGPRGLCHGAVRLALAEVAVALPVALAGETAAARPIEPATATESRGLVQRLSQAARHFVEVDFR